MLKEYDEIMEAYEDHREKPYDEDEEELEPEEERTSREEFFYLLNNL